MLISAPAPVSVSTCTLRVAGQRGFQVAAYGNNGTHDLNGSMTTGTGASPDVLSALSEASDHLPIVADFYSVTEPWPREELSTVMAVLDVTRGFQLGTEKSNIAGTHVHPRPDEIRVLHVVAPRRVVTVRTIFYHAIDPTAAIRLGRDK